MLTQKRLKEILSYNPGTGVFIRISTGKQVGTRRPDGYLRVMIDGKDYYLHRLAFMYMAGSFPENHADHINHIRDDNKWSNLQDVTAHENSLNTATTNLRLGVYEQPNGRYVAYASRVHDRKYLGCFNTKEEARQARSRFDYDHE